MFLARSDPVTVSGQMGRVRGADNEDQPAGAPATHLAGPSHYRALDPGPSVPDFHLKVLLVGIQEAGDWAD